MVGCYWLLMISIPLDLIRENVPGTGRHFKTQTKINDNIGQSSAVIGEISSDIAMVNQMAEGMSHNSHGLTASAGVSLIVGSAIMIFHRLKDGESVSNYRDWYLLGLVLGLGLTGMLSEITRLAGLETISYAIYLVHLVFVFNFMAFLPVSKLAHLSYRTLAMVYARYSKRE